MEEARETHAIPLTNEQCFFLLSLLERAIIWNVISGVERAFAQDVLRTLAQHLQKQSLKAS